MGAKEKRERERIEAINKRKQEVVEAAKAIFSIKSIESTSMQDIADKAEVGVASVYRYYKNKKDLVYAVAVSYIEHALDDYHVHLTGTGIEKLEQLIAYLLSQYVNKSALLSFAEQFEVFLLAHRGEQVDVFKEVEQVEVRLLTEVLLEGVKDGTIRSDVDVGKTTVTIVSLYRMIGQKIAFQAELTQEGGATPAYQLEIYKEMMIRYLANTA